MGFRTRAKRFSTLVKDPFGRQAVSNTLTWLQEMIESDQGELAALREMTARGLPTDGSHPVLPDDERENTWSEYWVNYMRGRRLPSCKYEALKLYERLVVDDAARTLRALAPSREAREARGARIEALRVSAEQAFFRVNDELREQWPGFDDFVADISSNRRVISDQLAQQNGATQVNIGL